MAMSPDEAARRIAEAKEQYALIDERARQWLTAESGSRQKTVDKNKQWFKEEPVHESSIFLYFDLASNHEAVSRAHEIQQMCATILGDDCFNPAPADRLHATIFTDQVLDAGRIADDQVELVDKKYQSLIAGMRPFAAFILGPHLTPGGLVLECRIHEKTLFEMRDIATALGEKGVGAPRVPSIEYATLGYVTGGTTQRLNELHRALVDLNKAVQPLRVDIDRVYVSLTINKRLTLPTIHHYLLSQPDAAGPELRLDALGVIEDPRERRMFEHSADIPLR